MTKETPSPQLPPDPVFSFLEESFPRQNPDPYVLRFSQYHRDHHGHLSAVFVQSTTFGTIIYRVWQDTSLSRGPAFVISARKMGGQEDLMSCGLTQDPEPHQVKNALSSAQIRVLEQIRPR